MSSKIYVQIATDDDETPGTDEIVRWAEHTLRLNNQEAEVTVRVVGLEEGRQLNEQWRGGAGPTNVLAFEHESLDVQSRLLGDVVVCAPVANAEALDEGRGRHAHWAHLVIHGTLHLLGYDHDNDADAAKMDALERTLLRELGYPDP